MLPDSLSPSVSSTNFQSNSTSTSNNLYNNSLSSTHSQPLITNAVMSHPNEYIPINHVDVDHTEERFVPRVL